MTTGEDHPQLVVADFIGESGVGVSANRNLDLIGRFSQSAVAAQLVEHSILRHLNQPRARIVGLALIWPQPQRAHYCVLHGVFDLIEFFYPEDARHRGDHLPRPSAEPLITRLMYAAWR